MRLRSRSTHLCAICFALMLCTGAWIRGAVILLPTPGLDLAVQRSASVTCTRNVQDILLASRLWSADHNGELPASFLELTNYLSAPDVLQCPANYREPAITNWNDLSLANIDYSAGPSADGELTCICRVHLTAARPDGTRVQGRERPGWPAFIADAVSHNVTPGSDVRFEVVVAPDALSPVQLQWRREDVFFQTNITFVTDPNSPGGGFWRTNRTTRFNVTPLPDETNTVLTLQNVQTNQDAFYSVTARNEMGAALSRRARLAVRADLLATTNWSETICLSNLRQIGLLARFWAEDHGERSPSNFAEMTNRFGAPVFGWPFVLFCRDDAARTPPSAWSAFDFQNTSYELFLPDSQNTNVVFTRCKIHPFYADGKGQAMSRPLLSFPLFSDNAIELYLYPFFGHTNILERSADFTTWTPVETFTNAYQEVFFAAPTTEPRLFYRLRLAQ